MVYDLFIIGGGINGCGIARDAAGRGLTVGLAEMNDLASATSGASTKLFHGGLRYLEYFEFRLVREALIEREILLSNMPHIAWPMRFVLPIHRDMRFETATPASRLLATLMPWMRGRRPAWLIRLGLFLYDHMGGRNILPPTATLDLRTDPAGAPLQDKYLKAFEYSDCWVQDSRLVLLNARDAADKGATILPRTRVTAAERRDGVWRITLEANGTTSEVEAKALVNAAGPWVGKVIRDAIETESDRKLRLVRGSHIVTKRLFDHDKCYFFQGTDGRIIFAIPYEDDFTLIGTTDMDHPDPDTPAVCTPEEKRYLLDFAARYLKTPLTEADIVWTYSGVRSLYDDGAASATAATRDYVLHLDNTGGAPLLNVFGGKITTYRKLAEAALRKLAPHLVNTNPDWTANAPLPGGDFPVDSVEAQIAALRAKYPFLTEDWSHRLIRTYGTEASDLLGNAQQATDLGETFGATITARELDWAIANEWVQTGKDFLWRRTKLGLKLDPDQIDAVDQYVRSKSQEKEGAAPQAAPSVISTL